MIIGAVWKGFLTGLWLSMSFGPVFFLLIQTSIQKGIKEAIVFDLGVFLSDIFYIVIAFFGAAIILENQLYKDWIGLIGGIVLLIFGIAPFLSRSKPVNKSGETESGENELPLDAAMATDVKLDKDLKAVARLNIPGLLAKGFVVNLVNPSVLFIWFGAATVAFATFEGKAFPVILYFVITLVTYFGIDILKIYLALKLKRFINPKALVIIHRISGLVVAVFGIYLIMNSF